MEILRNLHYIECMLERIASRDINYKNSRRTIYRVGEIQARDLCHPVAQVTFRLMPILLEKVNALGNPGATRDVVFNMRV